jgi:hypothetical protein
LRPALAGRKQKQSSKGFSQNIHNLAKAFFYSCYIYLQLKLEANYKIALPYNLQSFSNIARGFNHGLYLKFLGFINSH